MKLVREHIDERFTEDSDPIHDMGIGINITIEKLKKRISSNSYSSYWDPKDEDVIEYCIKSLRDIDQAFAIINYLFNSGRVDGNTSRHDFLSTCIAYLKGDRRIKMLEFLCDKVKITKDVLYHIESLKASYNIDPDYEKIKKI